MALSRVHTWSAGEVLLASDLNAEFNSILNNANSLISPFTANVSGGGFQLNNIIIGASTPLAGSFTTLAATLAVATTGGGYPSATASSITAVGGANPGLIWSNNSATANNSKWDMIAAGSTLLGRILSDDNGTQTNWISVTRSGNTVSGVTFGSPVGIGGTFDATVDLVVGASTTAVASIRIPHGVAPTSPSNGDMWSTTAGLFIRINGVTKTVTLT